MQLVGCGHDVFTCADICGTSGASVATAELPAVKFPYDIDREQYFIIYRILHCANPAHRLTCSPSYMYYRHAAMSVRVHRKTEAFYSFVTKLLGILGGTYTLMSMMNGATQGTVNVVKKLRMGKQM